MWSKPDYTEAHNNLGVILRCIESYGRPYRTSSGACPSSCCGDVYYNLGNVHKALGNEEKAPESFEKAIALDRCSATYINLGTALDREARRCHPRLPEGSARP